jgi:putative Mg2+ transporter-C (MgtC) family protein
MTEIDILLRMCGALVAGALIGLERTYRGRAAGLRTYALVALGSALLVGASEYAVSWAAPGRGDPTRVIQGIVTGIGFLGAGVILKEGFTVRGLTTAASIWVVAAIGVAFGAGLFIPGALATFLTWAALDLLLRLEGRVPVQSLVHCEVGFSRSLAFDDDRLRELVGRYGFAIDEFSCRLDGASQTLEYELVMRSDRADGIATLVRGLLAEPGVASFRIVPGRD